MVGRYPKIRYTEEGMREGMQIEDANIPVDSKVELLEALSETGLKEIVVGSFVSPKYTPQANIFDISSCFCSISFGKESSIFDETEPTFLAPYNF